MKKNQNQANKKSTYSNSARIWAMILAVIMFGSMLVTGIYYLVTPFVG